MMYERQKKICGWGDYTDSSSDVISNDVLYRYNMYLARP